MFELSQKGRKALRCLAAGVIASAAWVGPLHGVSVAAARPIVEVRIAPPAPRVEVVPSRPPPGRVWARGYWAWNGRAHAYHWVPGHYVVERRGYVYREPHWEPAPHGHYRYSEGHYDRR